MLVDTKYEFGLDAEGMLTIIDEVRHPGLSRYWRASTVEERRAAGDEPENLDKEYVRLAYGKTATTRSRTMAAAGAPALAASVYQETYAALTRRAFEPADIPPPSGWQRCSPTTAEPTIFCFTVPRGSGARTCR